MNTSPNPTPPLSRAVEAPKPPCGCMNELNEELKAKGFKIADQCRSNVIRGHTVRAVYGFPLTQIDGKKTKHGKPSFFILGRCPICGEEFP